MPTPSPFDFDENDLDDYVPERIERALVEQPALYLNQLRIAQHLEGWAGRLRGTMPPTDSLSGESEFADALREVAAHLRQGDYLNGGYLLDEPRQGIGRQQFLAGPGGSVVEPLGLPWTGPSCPVCGLELNAEVVGTDEQLAIVHTCPTHGAVSVIDPFSGS